MCIKGIHTEKRSPGILADEQAAFDKLVDELQDSTTHRQQSVIALAEQARILGEAECEC